MILQGHATLTHLGVIRVEGEDAASFLQGQLTNDVQLLAVGQSRLAAFLSAKGRMQASFIAIKRSANEFWLITSRDVLAQTLKRLSMFVLRAKAKLSDAGDAIRLLGLVGDLASQAAPSATPWDTVRDGEASVVRLYPADGQARALWAAPANESLPAPIANSPAIGLADWLLGEVRSAVPHITAPVVDAFVPQMVNFESIGGVSFKKGCYPGQEVVARSQFRGTLKRRMFLVQSEATELQAGQEVFAAGDADQPVGTIVQAAGSDALVSMQLAAAAQPLHVGTADGPSLQVQALPYALLEDI